MGSRLKTWLLAAVVAVVGLGAAPAGAQMPDLERWWRIDSPNFVLFTDAEPARGAEIVERLEEFRATFARLAPSLELRSPAPTTLYAFRDAESFAPYKSRPDTRGSRILGQFTKTSDGNYLGLDAGVPIAGSFSVIYHEYVHFLVGHNFPRVPLWFNEGLAEYYSTFEVQNGKAVLGDPVERHVDWLRSDGDFSLDDLLAADTASEAYHDSSEVGRFYALSWALVHYLLSGGEEEIDRAVDYFVRLTDGEDAGRAFDRAFGRRMRTMEEELRTYLETGNFATTTVRLPKIDSHSLSIRRSPPGDTLYRLGDLAVHLGKTQLAENLFQSALDHSSSHADTHAGLALVRDIQQRWPEADILFKDAMRLRPRQPLSFLLYGRHALVGAQQAEGEEAEKRGRAARLSLEHTVELASDFGEAHALLAAAHLLPGGDLDRALRAVRRARELLPGRLDLVELQIKTHLKRQELDLAERLIVAELVPRTSDRERVDRAFEDLERTKLLFAADRAFADDKIEQGLELLDRAIDLTTDFALRERLEGELVRLQKATADAR